MALTRLHNWLADEVLASADLNAEFNNLLNNSLTLISPLTADLAFGGFRLTGLSAGTVVSPALQPTGDTDTGVYFAAADTVNIGTGGVLRLTANSTGLTVANRLVVSGAAGPHAIGGASDGNTMIRLTGVGGAASNQNVDVVGTLSPAAAADGSGVLIQPTIVEAASGVHNILASLRVAPPTITDGVATTNHGATVYISGPPSAGVENHPLWVAAGSPLFGAGTAAGQENILLTPTTPNVTLDYADTALPVEVLTVQSDAGTQGAITRQSTGFSLIAGASVPLVLEQGGTGGSARPIEMYTNGTLRARVTTDGAVEMPEMTDAAAPAANFGRLYARDNGSGKTQLVVRFPTGAIQVLATEP